MKRPLALLFVLALVDAHAQFFVQKLSQEQISNAEKTFVVTNAGDTLEGSISSFSATGNGITKFTLKVGTEKTKYELKNIQSISIIPGEASAYEDFALIPVLKNVKNEDFIKVLPQDGRVIYERILLPGKSEKYGLAQLLNPGFDKKIKVYVHPDANTDGNVTSVNGLMVDGGLDDKHYVSINGGQAFVIGNFGYSKKAPKLLYASCPIFGDTKLKWKSFAKHVFKFDQQCE